MRSVFDDLNRLALDCGQALKDEDLELSNLRQYSHSPNVLGLKKNHVWVYSDEIWFLLGTVTPPPVMDLPEQIQDFFLRNEEGNYNPAPQLGGAISNYAYEGADGD